MSECAIMELTGFFRDPVTRMWHRLNHSMEANYFYSTVVGELTYSEAHSHCRGTYGNIGPNHMSDLFVTENLEVTTKIVKIQENFHKQRHKGIGKRGLHPSDPQARTRDCQGFRNSIAKEATGALPVEEGERHHRS